MLAMRPTRIFETVLYAEDLAAAERFYRDAIGLEVIGRGDLAVVFRCGWDEGGRSIYFRDPAGNVVELAPPTLWSGGWEF